MDPVKWAERYADMIAKRWGNICRVDAVCREAAFGGAEGDYLLETGEQAPATMGEMVRFFYARTQDLLS